MIKRTAPWFWIVVVILLGVIAKGPYRSYVYEHALNDFGLANVMPSFFTVILFVFLLSRWWSHPALFVGILGGSLGTELNHLDSAGRTFDVWDMVAIVVGWLVAVALLGFRKAPINLSPGDTAEQSTSADRAKARSG